MQSMPINNSVAFKVHSNVVTYLRNLKTSDNMAPFILVDPASSTSSDRRSIKPEHFFAHVCSRNNEKELKSVYFAFKLIQQKFFKVQIPKSDAKRNES